MKLFRNYCLLLVVAFSWQTLPAQAPTPGQNVNMVSGTTWPYGDPFLERRHCFLNLPTAAHKKRDAIADRETQFFPQALNAAHDLTRDSLHPEFVRYNRIERGKIATFLLDHHVARSRAHDRKILGT